MHEPNESDFDNGLPHDPPEPGEVHRAAPRKKGWTVLSWLVILAVAGFLAARSMSNGPGETDQRDRLQEMLFEMQARYLIGARKFVPGDVKELYEQAKGLDRGSFEQRLRFVVVAGELAGSKEALHKALALRAQKLDKLHERLAAILHNLYRDYVAGLHPAPSVPAEDRAYLREHLDWFAEVALHPGPEPAPAGVAAPAGAALALALEKAQPFPGDREDILAPAVTTFIAIIVIVITVCFLGFCGFVGLVVFMILLAKHQLKGRLAVGSMYGGVYAETFALFLVAFIGLSLWMQALPWPVPPLLRASLVTLGSLVVIVWPVVRGIPWGQVRQDIGWTAGRAPALEPVIGVACYVMALPIVLIGLFLTLILMAVRNELEALGVGALAQHEPIHPIIEFVVNGTAQDRLLVFIDACILAPIVEETMFRGVLYRHLRELSQRWAWLASVLVSGTLVSFIFAVIHPQGLVAVPVLMALAYGFTIAREWRGSLIPCMTAHALNNALVLLFVLLMMGR